MNKKSFIKVISLLLALLMAAGSFGLYAFADGDDEYEEGTPEYCEFVNGGHEFDPDGYCINCGTFDLNYVENPGGGEEDYEYGTYEYCVFVVGEHDFGYDGYCTRCDFYDLDYDQTLGGEDEYEYGTFEYCEFVNGGHEFKKNGCCAICGFYDEYYDESSDAIPLAVGSNNAHANAESEAEILYSFTAEESGLYAFYSVSDSDPYATVLDGEFNDYEGYDDERGYNFFTYLFVAENTTWYFSVGSYSNTEFDFDFHVKPVTYEIIIDGSAEDYVSVDVNYAPDEGETAYLLFDDGFTNYSVTADDGEGNLAELNLTYVGYTKGALYSFTMPASDVTVSASSAERKDYDITYNDNIPFRFFCPSAANEDETVVFTYDLNNTEYTDVTATVSYIDADDDEVIIEPDAYSFTYAGKVYTGFSFEMPGAPVNINLRYYMPSVDVSGKLIPGENTLNAIYDENTFYSFTPEETGTYYFMSETQNDPKAVLLNSKYEQIAYADDSFSSNNETYGYRFLDFGFTAYLNADETYYLGVSLCNSGEEDITVYYGRMTGNNLVYSRAQNGKVETDLHTASEGETVTVTLTPDEGYVLSELFVLSNQPTEIIYIDLGSETYTFEMPNKDAIVYARFESPMLIGASLSLGGEIGVKFYAIVPGITDGVYVRFTVDGRRQTVKINPDDAIEENGETFYPFVCEIGAPQINSRINAVLYVNGKEADTFEYSVMDYVNDCTYQYYDNQKLLNLVGALAQYGCLANNLFGLYPEFDLPQVNGYEGDYTNVDAGSVGDPSNSTTNVSSGAYIEGVSLVLRSKTALRLYFTLDADVELDEVCYNIPAISSEYVYPEVKTTERDGETWYCIEVPDIAPAEFGNEIEFEIFTTYGDIVVNYRPYDYIIHALRNVDWYYVEGDEAYNPALADCCRALYLYAKFAEDYFGV